MQKMYQSNTTQNIITRRMLIFFLSSFLCLCSLSGQNPAPDLTFSGDSKWFLPDQTAREEFTDILIDGGGRIILVGATNYDPDEGGKYRGVVVRLLANGTPDPTWGNNGLVYIDFPSSSDYISGVAMDNVGNIILCGRSNVASGAVYRLLGFNGSLDQAFGTGGRAVLNAAAAFNDIAILPNGKIVAFGWGLFSNNDVDLLISQFNNNGSMDTGFGTSSGYTLYGTEEDEYSVSMAVQADGKIVVAGDEHACGSDNCWNPIIGRFLANGQPDTGFGLKVITSAQNEAGSLEVALQNINGEERILLSGFHEPSTNNYPGFLMRFRNNGNSDNSFNNSATGFISFTNMAGCRVTVQNDNKILVVTNHYFFQNGNSFLSLRIMRRNADGTLDNSFGTNGIYDQQIGGYWDNPSVITSVGNKIYVAGSVIPTSVNTSDYDAFVVRLTSCSSGPSISNTVTNSSCNLANGKISVVAGGGIGSFNYAWSNGQNTANIQNLSAGNYTVTVTSAEGCSSVGTFNVLASPVTVASLSKVDAKCGQANGSATVQITGGPGVQSYQWNTGATTSSLSNLPAGNYSVTTTDLNGCTTILTTTIGATPLPIVNIAYQPTTCGNNNGTISVTQASGPAIVSYIWNTGITGANVNNLAPGTYTVTTTDINSCTTTSTRTIQPSVALAVTISKSDTYCGLNNGLASASANLSGATYQWSNGSTAQTIQNLGAGIYSVTVNAAGCTRVEQTIINSSDALNVNLNVIDVVCGQNNGLIGVSQVSGATIAGYQWSTGETAGSIQNLQSGTYTVTITDVNGCTSIKSGQVQSTPIGELTLSIIETTCGFNNGAICANTVGSILIGNYNWSTGGTNACISGLTSGNYSLTATDANGCQIMKIASVQASLPFSIELGDNVTIPSGQTANLSAETPNAISYLWSTGETTASISVNIAGVYTVTVTSNESCSTTDTIEVSTISATDNASSEIGIRLYPNPALDQVWLENASTLTGQVSVINITGQIVAESVGLQAGALTKLVVSSLPSGTYFVRILTKSQTPPIVIPFIKL